MLSFIQCHFYRRPPPPPQLSVQLLNGLFKTIFTLCTHTISSAATPFDVKDNNSFIIMTSYLWAIIFPWVVVSFLSVTDANTNFWKAINCRFLLKDCFHLVKSKTLNFQRVPFSPPFSPLFPSTELSLIFLFLGYLFLGPFLPFPRLFLSSFPLHPFPLPFFLFTYEVVFVINS